MIVSRKRRRISQSQEEVKASEHEKPQKKARVQSNGRILSLSEEIFKNVLSYFPCFPLELTKAIEATSYFEEEEETEDEPEIVHAVNKDLDDVDITSGIMLLKLSLLNKTMNQRLNAFDSVKNLCNFTLKKGNVSSKPENVCINLSSTDVHNKKQLSALNSSKLSKLCLISKPKQGDVNRINLLSVGTQSGAEKFSNLKNLICLNTALSKLTDWNTQSSQFLQNIQELTFIFDQCFDGTGSLKKIANFFEKNLDRAKKLKILRMVVWTEEDKFALDVSHFNGLEELLLGGLILKNKEIAKDQKEKNEKKEEKEKEKSEEEKDNAQNNEDPEEEIINFPKIEKVCLIRASVYSPMVLQQFCCAKRLELINVNFFKNRYAPPGAISHENADKKDKEAAGAWLKPFKTLTHLKIKTNNNLDSENANSNLLFLKNPEFSRNMFTKLKALRVLDFSGCVASAIPPLAKFDLVFPNLSALNFARFEIDDTSSFNFNNFPKITTLSLENMQINKFIWKSIEYPTLFAPLADSLKNLNILGMPFVTNSHFKGLSNLERLSFSITADELDEDPKTFKECKLTGEFFWKELKSLKNLEINDEIGKLNDNFFSFCGENKQNCLEYLNIMSSVNFSQKIFEFLKSLRFFFFNEDAQLARKKESNSEQEVEQEKPDDDEEDEDEDEEVKELEEYEKPTDLDNAFLDDAGHQSQSQEEKPIEKLKKERTSEEVESDDDEVLGDLVEEDSNVLDDEPEEEEDKKKEEIHELDDEKQEIHEVDDEKEVIHEVDDEKEENDDEDDEIEQMRGSKEKNPPEEELAKTSVFLDEEIEEVHSISSNDEIDSTTERKDSEIELVSTEIDEIELVDSSKNNEFEQEEVIDVSTSSKLDLDSEEDEKPHKSLKHDDEAEEAEGNEDEIEAREEAEGLDSEEEREIRANGIDILDGKEEEEDIDEEEEEEENDSFIADDDEIIEEEPESQEKVQKIQKKKRVLIKKNEMESEKTEILDIDVEENDDIELVKSRSKKVHEISSEDEEEEEEKIHEISSEDEEEVSDISKISKKSSKSEEISDELKELMEDNERFDKRLQEQSKEETEDPEIDIFWTSKQVPKHIRIKKINFFSSKFASKNKK